MSFKQNTNGRGYAPGWFLAEEKCSRETAQISANHAQAVTIGAAKIVPAGAVIPANGSTAKGILYEDVEVTTGDMPGSIVTKGVIYEDRLPASLDSDAKTALSGITVIDNAPAAVRPESFNGDSLAEISVDSAAGTAVGDTKITLSGYTPGAGESYKYKVGDTAASVNYGEVPGTGWTSWNGTADITAATDKKIAIVSVDSLGAAVAYGSATVTAKSGG